MISLFLSFCCLPLALSRSSPPPHFRATRSVLLSLQPPVFSLLTFSLSLSLSLSLLPSAAFSLFPSPTPRGPPFPHSRHPIPDTRYLIMLNASGFCGRIMRPRCPRTLFRSLFALLSLCLFRSFRTRTRLLYNQPLTLSRAQRFVTVCKR